MAMWLLLAKKALWTMPWHPLHRYRHRHCRRPRLCTTICQTVILLRHFYAAYLKRYDYITMPAHLVTDNRVEFKPYNVLDLERQAIKAKTVMDGLSMKSSKGRGCFFTVTMQPLGVWGSVLGDVGDLTQKVETVAFDEPLHIDIVPHHWIRP